MGRSQVKSKLKTCSLSVFLSSNLSSRISFFIIMLQYSLMRISVEDEIRREFENSLSEGFLRRLIAIAEKRNWFNDASLMNEISYLIGKTTGDGHLDYHFSLVFSSGRLEDLIRIRELIIEKFQLEKYRFQINKQYRRNGVSYRLRINDASIGRLCYAFGAPMGNKTKQSFNVPEWIQNSKKYKLMYLKALLEDELSTIKIEKSNYSTSPKLKMTKEKHLTNNLFEFLSDVKGIIEEFGVSCGRVAGPLPENFKENGIDTISMYFHIQRNKRNIIKFNEEIGFRLNRKKAEFLENCCTILKSTIHKSRMEPLHKLDIFNK